MSPTDNPWPAIVILASLAALLIVRGLIQGRVRQLALGGVFLLLAVGCYVLDMVVETPAEIIARKVHELTRAFQQQDVDKTLSYFAARAPERVVIRTMLKNVRVQDDLRISDVHVTFRAADSLAISHFRANASVSVHAGLLNADVGYHPSRWELDWQKEGDDWKVTKVHRLHPINGKEMGFMDAD